MIVRVMIVMRARGGDRPDSRGADGGGAMERPQRRDEGAPLHPSNRRPIRMISE
jgi:hypothetical protein